MIKKHILLYSFFFLFFYGGIRFVSPGTKFDLFIPSSAWYAIGCFLSALCALGFSMHIFWKVLRGGIAQMPQPAFKTGIFVISCFPVLFYLFYVALVYGGGEIVTEATVKESFSFLTAWKNQIIERRTRWGRFNAYCVTLQTPGYFLRIEDYCLEKVDYDMLSPAAKPFPFYTRTSWFGTVINGYYSSYDMLVLQKQVHPTP